MSDRPAMPGGAMPGSVRGARALLNVQGAIWGLVCLGTFFYTSPSLAGQYGSGEQSITLSVLIVLAGLTGGSFHLAAELARPGHPRVRVAAIGLESFMTVFGVAIVGLAGFAISVASSEGGPAPLVALAGLIGAVLSCAVVRGMLGADARRYCAGEPSPAAKTVSGLS